MQQKTISATCTEYNSNVDEKDLNGYGLMHGGRLLTLCDEIGYQAARKHTDYDCLTRAAHDVNFLSMMIKDDPFSVQAKVILTGRTTLWVSCSVKSIERTVMRAVFVYIAVDKRFKPLPVATIHAESNREIEAQAAMQKLMVQVKKKP